MPKHTPSPEQASREGDRRRFQRARILGALHGVCLQIEGMQGSEEARRACREVARMLGRERVREIAGREREGS